MRRDTRRLVSVVFASRKGQTGESPQPSYQKEIATISVVLVGARMSGNVRFCQYWA